MKSANQIPIVVAVPNEKDKHYNGNSAHGNAIICVASVTIIIIILVTASLTVVNPINNNHTNTIQSNEMYASNYVAAKSSSNDSVSINKPPIAIPFIPKKFEVDSACKDPVWCTIQIPNKSYFKFSPPNDNSKWRQAQVAAANNEHIFLPRILKAVTNPFEVIDGDIHFRSMHYFSDFFVEANRDLSPLVTHKSDNMIKFEEEVKSNSNNKNKRKRLKGKKIHKWEKEGITVIPPKVYDFRRVKRAPIISLGYHGFEQHQGQYYTGKLVDVAWLTRFDLYKQWNDIEQNVNEPFLMFFANNENWGIFSTIFPNRTVDWGSCCNAQQDIEHLEKFLNHNKTLVFLINQHSNITHPKVLTLPRGLPGPDEFSRKLIWDTGKNIIQQSENNNNKRVNLMFTATSSWGPRPQIMRCVAKKFDAIDFEGQHAEGFPGTPEAGTVGAKPRISKEDFYIKLAKAKFCLSLPGLGYDTYRLWEALYLGAIPIIEQNIGLDRTVWRLPVLIVEDYDMVTPELLRTAYIEAIYHADDFEYQRLTQRFWSNFIMNISISKNNDALFELFPMKAVDTEFARPSVPYNCSNNNCGKGTKRTPSSYC
eukprot:gene10709-14380_t